MSNCISHHRPSLTILWGWRISKATRREDKSALENSLRRSEQSSTWEPRLALTESIATPGKREALRQTCGIFWILFLLVCSLLVLASCGGGRSSGIGSAVTITIAASSPSNSDFGNTNTAYSGDVVNVTANIYDPNNGGVTWAMSPLNAGTLVPAAAASQTPGASNVSSVTYTAPSDLATATPVTITATSTSNPAISSSLTISVDPASVRLYLSSDSAPALFFEWPAGVQTMIAGGTLQVGGVLQFDPFRSQGNLTWSLSPPSGSGTLAVVQNTKVSSTALYSAPPTVSSPEVVTITATSLDFPTATSSMQITVLPTGECPSPIPETGPNPGACPNVVPLQVDNGPIPGQQHPNQAFTAVTICSPASLQSQGSGNYYASCQTVHGILVDTRSSGLRILQSAIPQVKLGTITDGRGDTLQNCFTRGDGSYLWGPVSSAAVVIGSEMTTSSSNSSTGGLANIQVISSANTLVPNGCSNGSVIGENTPQLLGANGILGIGPEPTDCTVAGSNRCDGSVLVAPPNVYYSCPKEGCSTSDSPVTISGVQQVTNPVILFQNLATGSSDNNGVVLNFPPVVGTQSSVTGTLSFGIPANAVGYTQAYTLDQNDNFTSIYANQSLTSYIDLTSPAILFPDTIPICPMNASYYCPPQQVDTSAKIRGAGPTPQGKASAAFSVANADTLFAANPTDAAFSALGGPKGTPPCSVFDESCAFVWGMPFFYGRTVYIGIDGQTVVNSDPYPALPPTPWFAF